MKTACYIKTINALGLTNVTAVAMYRTLVKSGVLCKLMPFGDKYMCKPFEPRDEIANIQLPNPEYSINRADCLLNGKFRYFGAIETSISSPPDWFVDAFNNTKYPGRYNHWTNIDDFNSEQSDIKIVWELSRFAWAPVLAQAYVITNDEIYLNNLNTWVCDWTIKNPLNSGPNWKCGQEASIRLLNILLAAQILRQHATSSKDLIRFVCEHCRRIEPTIRYALAQDNNHGTSEAAALFIGGAWIAKSSSDPKIKKVAQRWRGKGRRWLEDRVKKLIAEDGSFSQHSVVYHRLALDTLSLVEFWRRELGESEFSKLFYLRARAAVDWLYQMIDPACGDAPNLGANDGSLLLQLSSLGYRDFRPSLQLASALFNGGRLYADGPWNDPLEWLNIDQRRLPSLQKTRKARQYSNGGYVLFKSEASGDLSWGVLTYPNFKFRPSHADGMHLDIWCQGVNLLRDSGSYSYNTNDPLRGYFGSTSAHNTAEMDGRDQMPRLGRFLYGDWLKMDDIKELQEKSGVLTWSGRYTDYNGASHTRTVEFNNGDWRIIDELMNFKSFATLRWRLAPGEWRLNGNRCDGLHAVLEVDCNAEVSRSEIVDGWEARYYWQKNTLPVWEIQVRPPRAVLETRIILRKNRM